MSNDPYAWHLLDARAIWVKELAAALAKDVSLLGWIPEITWLGRFRHHEYREEHPNPHLTLQHFPLQRGFARWPLRALLPEAPRIVQRLLRYSADPKTTVLLCASPHYAAVAERWPGPVIYYMSDLYYAWGEDPAYINYHDRRLCQRANLVCPVSERGKDYLVQQAACPESKIAISPMGTRAENILDEPLLTPAPLPALIADIPRPVVGVIGNLAANTDWLFLQDAIAALQEVSWIFVGSTEMPIDDSAHAQARSELERHSGRVRFLGPRPYHELADYARSFDVALLPYRKREPTYSGSSTRFYEHLAACRPMLATKGFAELLTKESLVHLVDSASQFVERFRAFQTNDFRDGHEVARWKASKTETWEARASAMRKELATRLSQPQRGGIR
jgi:glycosyltransferase involved in cell wall biosynthesis